MALTVQSQSSQQIYEQAKDIFTTNNKPLMKACSEIGSMKELSKVWLTLYLSPDIKQPTIEDLKKKRDAFDNVLKKINTARDLATTTMTDIEKTSVEMSKRIIDPMTLDTIKTKQPSIHEKTLKENELCQRHLNEIKQWNAQLKIIGQQVMERSTDASKHVHAAMRLIESRILVLEPTKPIETGKSLVNVLTSYMPNWGSISATPAENKSIPEKTGSQGEKVESFFETDVEIIQSETLEETKNPNQDSGTQEPAPELNQEKSFYLNAEEGKEKQNDQGDREVTNTMNPTNASNSGIENLFE